MRSLSELLGRGSQYRDLLRTEAWKTFSRRIRDVNGNACRACKRSNVVTQVHHFAYESDRLPWEYKDDEVVLLCGACHEQLHTQLQQFRRFVFGKLTPQSFQVLNGALAVGLDHVDPLKLAYAIAEMCASPQSVERFAGAWERE